MQNYRTTITIGRTTRYTQWKVTTAPIRTNKTEQSDWTENTQNNQEKTEQTIQNMSNIVAKSVTSQVLEVMKSMMPGQKSTNMKHVKPRRDEDVQTMRE